ERVDKYRSEMKIWMAIAEDRTDDARESLRDADELPKEQRARLWHRLGDSTNCLELAKELAKGGSNQAPALALAAYLSWEAGDMKVATNTFRKLRRISSRFDLDVPLLARLSPIAKHFALPADWR